MTYYYFTKKDKTLSLTTDGPSKYDPDGLIEYEGDLDLSYSMEKNQKMISRSLFCHEFHQSLHRF